MAKGLSLPIEMIVIIAVAVLVLVVIAAFFSGYFTTGVNTIAIENAFSQACGALRSGYNCDPFRTTSPQITARLKTGDPEGTVYSLAQICTLKGISDTTTACARACGCNV